MCRVYPLILWCRRRRGGGGVIIGTRIWFFCQKWFTCIHGLIHKSFSSVVLRAWLSWKYYSNTRMRRGKGPKRYKYAPPPYRKDKRRYGGFSPQISILYITGKRHIFSHERGGKVLGTTTNILIIHRKNHKRQGGGVIGDPLKQRYLQSAMKTLTSM